MYLLEFYSGTFLKPKSLVQTIEIFVLLSNITHLKRDLTPSLVFIKLVISIYIYHTCQNYSKFFHVFLWLATTEMFLFNLQCKTVLRNHIQKYERKIKWKLKMTSTVWNDKWVVAFTHSKKLISGQSNWKHLLQPHWKIIIN